MKKTTSRGTGQASNVIQLNTFDPQQVNQRLYNQVSALLSQLEEKDSRSKVTMRERIAALIAIGRIQELFIKMRKATGDAGAGSTVKKYSTAAFSDAARGRTKNTGRTSEPQPTNWFDDLPGSRDYGDDGDDDGDDAA